MPDATASSSAKRLARGIHVYPFNLSAELLCEVPCDAATATAKIRQFIFQNQDPTFCVRNLISSIVACENGQ